MNPIDCPECGSPNTEAIVGLRGDIAPGERAIYECKDCGELWKCVVPEPTDEAQGYMAEGYARNH